MLDIISDMKQTGSGGDAAAKRWESGTTNQTRGNGRLQILSYLVASESRFESVISRLFLHPFIPPSAQRVMPLIIHSI